MSVPFALLGAYFFLASRTYRTYERFYPVLNGVDQSGDGKNKYCVRDYPKIFVVNKRLHDDGRIMQEQVHANADFSKEESGFIVVSVALGYENDKQSSGVGRYVFHEDKPNAEPHDRYDDTEFEVLRR